MGLRISVEWKRQRRQMSSFSFWKMTHWCWNAWGDRWTTSRPTRSCICILSECLFIVILIQLYYLSLHKNPSCPLSPQRETPPNRKIPTTSAFDRNRNAARIVPFHVWSFSVEGILISTLDDVIRMESMWFVGWKQWLRILSKRGYARHVC